MGIIDSMKDVASLVQNVANIDLYEKTLDLRGQVLDVVTDKQAP